MLDFTKDVGMSKYCEYNFCLGLKNEGTLRKPVQMSVKETLQVRKGTKQEEGQCSERRRQVGGKAAEQMVLGGEAETGLLEDSMK